MKMRFAFAFVVTGWLVGPSSALQGQGPGHQTFVWDSMDSVDPGTGQQPVDGWGFHYYRKSGSHDSLDLKPMTWVVAPPAPLTCDGLEVVGVAGEGAWVALDPQGDDLCCFIKPYQDCTAPLAEQEQSSRKYASVRSWTAPRSGTVTITTPHHDVKKVCSLLRGDGVDIRIYRNDLIVFERKLEFDDFTGFDIDESVPVNAGDVLWFHNDVGEVGDGEGDGVVFLPLLHLLPNAGYPTAVVAADSSADFSVAGQGVAGWSYEAYDPSAGTYSLLSPCTDHWEPDMNCLGGSPLQITESTQHPATGLDAVRVWTAPQDGWVKLESDGNIRKAVASGGAVGFTAWLRRSTGDPVVMAHELIEDTVGAPIGIVAHLRTGDRIELHATPDPTNPLGVSLIVDVALTLDPWGEEPRTSTILGDPQNPGDVFVAPGEFWFYEDVHVHGNLVIDNASVYAYDSSVRVMNTFDNQFSFDFRQNAKVTTVRSTVGGGNTLHGSFRMQDPGDALWKSLDTKVEYSYSQAIFDQCNYVSGCSYTSKLHGVGHDAGKEPDFIHVGPGGEVSLVDSTFGFRLMFPANTLGIVADLPVDVAFTNLDIEADFPIAGNQAWDLSLENCTVPLWDLAPYGMTNLPQDAVTIDVSNMEKFAAELSGLDLQGTINPLFVGPLMQPLTTFNVTWDPGLFQPELLYWAAYFSGPASNVTLNGPSLIAELFSMQGARVSYIGTSGTHDAETMATVLKSLGWDQAGSQRSRLIVKNATVGKANVRAQVRAEGGAYIRIEEAELIGDISFEADGMGPDGITPSQIDIVNLTNPDLHEITFLCTGGGTIAVDGVVQCP